MALIRIVSNWRTPNILRQTPGGLGKWGNHQFTLDPVENCDYILFLNAIYEDIEIICSPENVWAMLQEPYIPGIFDWMVRGHEQFSKVFTHHIFNNHPKYIGTQTCLPWHVDKSFDELINISVPLKSKGISWITTNKTVFPGHKDRMRFYDKLKSDNDLSVDVFGFGIQHVEDKWDVLAPYKYSLAIENTSSKDYWTEKLADCFLSYTLPVYYGCANLEEYFPEKSFIRIDINNFYETKKLLQQLQSDDFWADRLDAIIEARNLLLNKYQLFPFISDHIASHERSITMEMKKEKISLSRTMTQNKPTIPKISVIVCTYNREKNLPDCLNALMNQNVGPHNYEVIIVNNNSTDNTREVAEKYCAQNKNFRYFFELQQGLSIARNLGYGKALAEYVAFIDDDAIAPKNWIYTAMQIIAQFQPDIFGGPALPIFPNGKPEWFKDEYGIRGDMGNTGWLKEGFIVGTNIFFKKELLVEYGGFDPELGMKGNTIAYHEETKLVFRAFEEERKVYYSRELAVKDYIPDYKKSLGFFIHAKYQAGKYGVGPWKPDYGPDEIIRLLSLISSTMNDFDNAYLKRDENKYPYPENYIIENIVNNFFRIGMRVEYFLKKFREEGKEAIFKI